jgi:hypothetical protein
VPRCDGRADLIAREWNRQLGRANHISVGGFRPIGVSKAGGLISMASPLELVGFRMMRMEDTFVRIERVIDLMIRWPVFSCLTSSLKS